MKKMYKHPKMEFAPVEPVSIICFSSGEGEGGTGGGGLGEGDKVGDAPKRRRIPPF